MELPDLSRIVEANVPVSDSLLTHLRRDVLPGIRKLQADAHLRWFSFLLHHASQLVGRDPSDRSLVIHLRLEPATNLDVTAFAGLLPELFKDPHPVTLPAIVGLDASILIHNDWAQAWKIHGEASEWVLGLLEGHHAEPSVQQIVQFLHFITNPLGLGNQCRYMPAGISF